MDRMRLKTGISPLQPWKKQTVCPRKERPDPTMKDGRSGDTGKRPEGDRTNDQVKQELHACKLMSSQMRCLFKGSGQQRKGTNIFYALRFKH